MQASGWLLILVLLAVIGIGGFAWYRAEGEPPGLTAPEAELVIGRAGVKLDLRATDARSGLRALRVAVAQPGGAEQVLLDESYPGNLLSGGTRNEQTASLQLDPAALGALKGPGMLAIAVRDWSWRGGLGGNETRRDVPLRVDVDPPRDRGHERDQRHHLRAPGRLGCRRLSRLRADRARRRARGRRRVRGFPRKGGGANERIALFAVPTEVDANPPVRVFAEDAAGNASEAGWSVVVQPYVQPEGKVQLTQRRSSSRSCRGSRRVERRGDAAFQEVNTRVRAENETRIRELVANTLPSCSSPAAAPARQLDGDRAGSARNASTWWTGARSRAPCTTATTSRRSPERRSPRRPRAACSTWAISGSTATASCSTTASGSLRCTDTCRASTSRPTRASRPARRSVSPARPASPAAITSHFATLVGNTYVDPIEWWDAKWVAITSSRT